MIGFSSMACVIHSASGGACRSGFAGDLLSFLCFNSRRIEEAKDVTPRSTINPANLSIFTVVYGLDGVASRTANKDRIGTTR
jgi:hypothetical protein